MDHEDWIAYIYDLKDVSNLVKQEQIKIKLVKTPCLCINMHFLFFPVPFGNNAILFHYQTWSSDSYI